MNYKIHSILLLILFGSLTLSYATEFTVYEFVKEEVALVDAELMGAPVDSVYITALLKTHNDDARVTFLFSTNSSGVLECKTTILGLATKGQIIEVLLKSAQIPESLKKLRNSAYKAKK